MKEKINDCGLFVHPEVIEIAASADGVLEKSGNIVEIKCPYSAVTYKTIEYAYLCNVSAIIGLFTNKTCTKIRNSHDYYYQVQTQLNVTGKDTCHFMVWIPNDYKVIQIKKDEIFWRNKMLSHLTQFYETCLEPEIVDSRLSRRMPIKDPKHILDAKKKVQSLKLKKLEKWKINDANKTLKHGLKMQNHVDAVNAEQHNLQFTDKCNVMQTLNTNCQKSKAICSINEDSQKSINVDAKKTDLNIQMCEKNSSTIVPNVDESEKVTSKSNRIRRKPVWLTDDVQDGQYTSESVDECSVIPTLNADCHASKDSHLKSKESQNSKESINV